jgi:hypothetical protein
MRLALSAMILLLSLGAAAQEGTVLRISVVLTDADGNAMPIPRAQLLISDNPATREPRRVRTGADGTLEIRLPAGSYTVESDTPVALGGRYFTWTQTLDVPAGRDTLLALTAANADLATAADAPAGNPAATSADGAAILNKWRGSIAGIWTPTAHATGFVISTRGLIATNDRAIGDATNVEVEFGGANRIKVPGRVVASDRTLGVSIIWIDSTVVESRAPIAPLCADPAPPWAAHDEKVVALIAPMLEPEQAVPGIASRADAQSFRADWRLDTGSAGGPVFAADGTAIGITVAGDDQGDRERREEAYVIPLNNTCRVLGAAAQEMAGAAPPPATRLRTEAEVPRAAARRVDEPAAPRVQAPLIAADEFDISLVTPAMIEGVQGIDSPRSFFGYWMPYLLRAPQVLLVRVSPQFEESFWKMIARGAARTQGIALPPLASFNANFLRMRTFCGAAEVMPIQRLIIEMPIKDRKPVREGLYVYALTDFGRHCPTVRVDLFSEKSPNKPDTRTIDPALFSQIATPRR